MGRDVFVKIDAPTTEGRGQPRQQYAKTYNVIPAHVASEQAVEIFRRCWESGHETVGGSYDDAGVGNLKHRLARLWEIPAADHQRFLHWYAEHYWGVKVEFASLGPETIWDRDISGELARNDHCTGKLSDGWWQRTLEQIVGLTVHHTLSNSPHATARHYIHKDATGRPSIPYHLWVTETGEVLKCLDFEEGCWHDHTGHRNVHLSLGLAGHLHKYRPSEPQLDAAARVVAWALEHPEMHVTFGRVKGHQNYHSTECPGWHTSWRDEFFRRVGWAHIDRLALGPYDVELL